MQKQSSTSAGPVTRSRTRCNVRQEAIERLAWMWCAIFSISLLSFTALGSVWPSQLLLFAGVLGTLAVLKQARSRRPKRAPVPHLSGASKCVWQMDREA